MHGLRPGFVERVRTFVTYDRGMIVSAGFMLAGLMLLGHLVYRYLKLGLNLEAISHPAILGLLLIILGFQTFCFTLLMEMAKRVIKVSTVSSRAGRELWAAGIDPGRPAGSMAVAAGNSSASPNAERSRGVGARLRLSCHAVNRLGTKTETRHWSGFPDRAGAAERGRDSLFIKAQSRRSCRSWKAKPWTS